MTQRLPEEFFHQYLTKGDIFFAFYWKTYAARVWFTGNGFTGILRWWHPITFLVLLILTVLAVPVCLFSNQSMQDYFRTIWRRIRLAPQHRARLSNYREITHTRYRAFIHGR